jgi:KipI family sensor histidine kinase inhibitor
VIRPFGEAALLVELGSSELAQALAASLRDDPLAGVVEAVPGLDSVMVEVDGDPDPLVASLGKRVSTLDDAPLAERSHVIPVDYDGPDLEEVAVLTGLTPADVASRHAATELRVLFCGFAPGFAYLGHLPPELQVDRLATPRTHTLPGSVAIAGSMSGIYPADLPGGWRVIGRTSVNLFDPRWDPPALLIPGDRVRFEPI